MDVLGVWDCDDVMLEDMLGVLDWEAVLLGVSDWLADCVTDAVVEKLGVWVRLGVSD